MTEVWTAPTAFSAGATFPYANYDTDVRDNLTHLKEIVNAPLVNRDSTTLVVGDVVVLDIANVGVERTTTDAHAGPVYVVDTASTAVGASLYVHPAGSICLVKVNGAIVFGDLLKTSTTAGRAAKTTTNSEAFARALQANASGDATILCQLLERPIYVSSAGLDYGEAGDIQPTGTAAAAGSTGEVADAGHVHLLHVHDHTGDTGDGGSLTATYATAANLTTHEGDTSTHGVAEVVGATEVQSLTNKSLTSPKIVTSILDTNGNELFKVTATASAVNELTLANAATGNKPSLTASGDDPNIGWIAATKGTGDGEIWTNGARRAIFRGSDGHLKLLHNVSFGGGSDPDNDNLMFVDNNTSGKKFTTAGTTVNGAAFTPTAEITSGAHSAVMTGFRARPLVDSGNTQNWTATVGVIAVRATTLIRPTSGTITGAAAIYVADDAGTGGTVTNWYGLYMEPPTRGATNYGLYVLGGTHRIEGALTLNDDGAAVDVRVEGDTDANLLFTDGSADTVQVGAATASDSAKFYVSGKISCSGELEVNGDLNHDGSNVGFFGVAPAARPSAYTPSNVTPDRSYDADTVAVAELADIVGTLIADLQSLGLLQ